MPRRGSTRTRRDGTPPTAHTARPLRPRAPNRMWRPRISRELRPPPPERRSGSRAGRARNRIEALEGPRILLGSRQWPVPGRIERARLAAHRGYGGTPGPNLAHDVAAESSTLPRAPTSWASSPDRTKNRPGGTGRRRGRPICGYSRHPRGAPLLPRPRSVAGGDRADPHFARPIVSYRRADHCGMKSTKTKFCRRHAALAGRYRPCRSQSRKAALTTTHCVASPPYSPRWTVPTAPSGSSSRFRRGRAINPVGPTTSSYTLDPTSRRSVP